MRIYNHLFTGTFKREPKPVAGAVEYKTFDPAKHPRGEGGRFGEGENIVVPIHPKDHIYIKLMAKGIPVGINLYELSEKQISPKIRHDLDFRGRPEETISFLLRPKSEVTGQIYDRGYILRDKRPDYIARNTPTR